MGREVMRVPMDFDCPIGTTWSGRLNPHKVEPCPTCDGYGRNKSYKATEALARLILLAGADSQRGRLHPYFQSTPISDVGSTLHELSGGLAGRPPSVPFGHDSIDAWHATEAIIRAAGLDPETWGVCETCKGDGHAPGQEEAIRLQEEWTEQEVPKGDGWQLWQTVSEGGPVSPVFAAPEELARWMATPGNDASITSGRSYEEWLRFITGPGWAPSMIADSRGLVSGVEAAARDAE